MEGCPMCAGREHITYPDQVAPWGPTGVWYPKPQT